MDQPKLIDVPFADAGDKNEIPNTPIDALTNRASMQAGFPPITGTPPTSGGLPPLRADFNGIFNLLSQHIAFQNKGGFYKFDNDFATAIGGYSKGAVLINDTEDKLYISLADNNTYNFNSNSSYIGRYWKEIDAAGGDKAFIATYGATTAQEIIAFLDGADPKAPMAVKRNDDYYTVITAIKLAANRVVIRTFASLSGTYYIFTYDITDGTWASSNYGIQQSLTSGTNIKTINGQSVLGSGDLVIEGGGGGGDFLPLAGGTMTGTVYSTTQQMLRGQNTATGSYKDISVERADGKRIAVIRFQAHADTNQVSIVPCSMETGAPISPHALIVKVSADNEVSVQAITPPTGDSSRKIATTEWVLANAGGGSGLPTTGGEMTGAIVNDVVNGPFVTATTRARRTRIQAPGGNTEMLAAGASGGDAGLGVSDNSLALKASDGTATKILEVQPTGIQVKSPGQGERPIVVSGDTGGLMQIVARTAALSGSSITVSFSPPFRIAPMIMFQPTDPSNTTITLGTVTTAKATFNFSNTSGSVKYIAIGERNV